MLRFSDPDGVMVEKPSIGFGDAAKIKTCGEKGDCPLQPCKKFEVFTAREGDSPLFCHWL